MRLVDVALFIVAVVAGFLLTASAMTWTGRSSTVESMPAAVPAAFSDVRAAASPTEPGAKAPISVDPATALIASLSEEEAAVCAREAKTAGDREKAHIRQVEQQLFVGVPGFSRVLAQAQARVACLARTRPERLCTTAERRDLVMLVSTYVTEYSKMAGFLEMAEQQSSARSKGNASTASPSFDQKIRDAERQLVAEVHGRMKRTLRRLSSNGHLSLSDFQGQSELLVSLVGTDAPATSTCSR